MTEPTTEANSQNAGDLFLIKKSSNFQKTASGFPFVIEIVIVTELNTKLKIQSLVLGSGWTFTLWMVKLRLSKREAVVCIF